MNSFNEFYENNRGPAHAVAARRRGITRAEVLVLIVVLSMVGLVVVAALPRQRENARMAGCRHNLMQIGQALALYDRDEGRLPGVPPLGSPATGSSPLMALLEAFQVPDLTELGQDGRPPKPGPGFVPGERLIVGFTCPSDTNARSGIWPAPVSYRACAGDRPDGRNGGFAPGGSLSMADIEAGDGRSFTAAFAERLIGTGKDGVASLTSYALVPGSLRESANCPGATPGRWRGDAGASWRAPGWRSTLYNHALPPGGLTSCLADDGRSAFMGASSGHLPGVNVLIFDGSVRTVRPTMALPLWKALATVRSPAAPVLESR